uniref:Secreted protein n=1 Tax=Sciurus vulgaris TaxID=55149 RepID=A0A8D2JM37_SCIVU
MFSLPWPLFSVLLLGRASLQCNVCESRRLLTFPAQYCFSVLALNDKPHFLLKHVAGHGSYEVAPPSAFWLWLLGIFNLIYLFPLFKTKQFLAH